MRLAGKTAVITGGTTGIGFATAERFLTEGAKVLIVGCHEARLNEAYKQLAPHGEISTVQADVRLIEDIEQIATYAEIKFNGTLDVLFANSGVSHFGPFESLSERSFDDEIAVNFRGVFFTVQKLARLLGEGSSVVLNGSSLNQTASPNLAAYGATKAAVRSLGRTFADELKHRGVRVNVVATGATDTPIFDKYPLSPEEVSDLKEGLRSAIPMGRFADPAEIAAAVLFLASDESSYILGEEITVDGGLAVL
ncbi:SDR family oxidoreductase [Streptomyces sp. IB201691-2A2]|uniref:SDR family oxidoreductase n=1 Tax=Streptomyces sp. IB201691-2A2 TaxID=2561920 RepID=UPI001180A5ED|nr:SDR family oxidoreductase [Streptomyces sp. IB201691-2A2]TRO55535.1 SDR family oxidoreductase [Streptomyces sp. IB201691-2A2]